LVSNASRQAMDQKLGHRLAYTNLTDETSKWPRSSESSWRPSLRMEYAWPQN
jgi:hypothetical protein